MEHHDAEPFDYADIINHPHHVSSRHQPMSMYDRAAQFAPFDALSGISSVVSSQNS